MDDLISATSDAVNLIEKAISVLMVDVLFLEKTPLNLKIKDVENIHEMFIKINELRNRLKMVNGGLERLFKRSFWEKRLTVY